MTDEIHAPAETAGDATAAASSDSVHTQNKKQVSFQPEPNNDKSPDNGERSEGEDAAGPDDAGTAPVGVGSVAKKKKKRKSKMSRGIGKPTGFEEYFVDAPITPIEHEEEQLLYSPKKGFLR